MKHTDWQSLHVDAYKSYMKQRYNEDIDIDNRVYTIDDEEQFDKHLIHIHDVK